MGRPDRPSSDLPGDVRSARPRLRSTSPAGRSRRWRSLFLGLGCAAVCSSGVSAEVLLVGPQRNLHAPSDAAAVARDGDIVRIDPGEYVDCAIWRANQLVLEAPSGEAHMRDRACNGKAIWVISGADVTVANIAFSGARVADQNGAGIRAEGRNLTVRHARFVDNENGILAAPVAGSTISIEGSTFERNGTCAANCAHGIYVNAIARLKIVSSTFREQRAGHHIKSAALALEVSGSTIEDGPDGTASYLIDITSGGEVVIADNDMQKGPNSENWGTAIHIAGEGSSRDATYRISQNRFRSDNPHEVAFVRNQTAVPAVLEGNQLDGTVVALVGPGSVDRKPSGATIAGPDEEPAAAADEEPPAGPAPDADLEAKLRLLKRLFEEDLITQEEYTAKKAQLLKSF